MRRRVALVADFDRALLLRLRTLPHSRAGDAAVAYDSRLREHAALWLALGLAGVALDRRRRAAWARATVAVAAAEAASQAIKRTLRRPRPDLPDLSPLVATPSRFSFPSAHTAAAVAASRTAPRRAAARLAGVVALLTALSRPYAGVHYPSDVAAGAALGWAIGTSLR